MGVIVVVVLAIYITFVKVPPGSSTEASPILNLSAEAQGNDPSSVGDSTTQTVTVTNRDTDIADLVILYANGRDNWLDNHVLARARDCTVNTHLKAFECGPLKAGESMAIEISGTAKDAGQYTYNWGLGDERKDQIRVWDQVFVWSENVAPASGPTY